MKLRSALIALAVVVPSVSLAQAGGSVFLDGNMDFLQSGSITNTSVGVNLTSFTFSFGTAADGIATWDGSTGGGTASGFLSDPQYFQTVTWGGLNLAPGATFNFGGLDIDLIVTLVPLNVTGGTLDFAGTSLANGYVQATYSNGATLGAELNTTGWNTNQSLRLANVSSVPEPSTYVMLASGLLAIGLGARRRRQR